MNDDHDSMDKSRNQDLQVLKQQVDTIEKELNEVRQMLLVLSGDQKTIAGRVDAGKVDDHRPQSPAISRKSDVNWESVIVSVWLPRVFMMVLLLGVAFAFGAAIHYGWLNQTAQSVIGYLASIFVVALGERQIREQRPILGKVLLGGGIAIGILTTMATHLLFGLIPALLAFTIYIALLTASVTLSIMHRSSSLAIFSLVGAYLIPFVLHGGDQQVAFVVLYEWVTSVFFILYAVFKKYKLLYFLSVGLYHVTLAIVVIAIALHSGIRSSDAYWVMLGVIIQHLLLLYLLISKKVTPHHPRISVLTHFALVMVWAWALPNVSEHRAWLALGFVTVYAVLAIVFYQLSEKNKMVISLSVALLATVVLINATLQASSEVLAFSVDGILSVFLGLKVKDKLQFWIGVAVFAVGSLDLLVRSLWHLTVMDAIAWLIIIGTTLMAHWFIQNSRLKQVWYWMGVLMILIFVSEISNALTSHQSFGIQHLVMDVTWMVYSIVAIVIGLTMKHRNSRLTGIILLFVTLAKLILVDFSDVSIIIRAILFIILGVSGLAASRLLYKGTRFSK